ncbi:MAG: efflux transporter outer membrane subunit [Methylococcaceae bacterium]|nr:MAG: efflux transporter outer membrane subunit [Methylococcaceae bacterium]
MSKQNQKSTGVGATSRLPCSRHADAIKPAPAKILTTDKTASAALPTDSPRRPLKTGAAGSGVLLQAFFITLMAGCAIKRDQYDVPTAPLPDQYKQTAVSTPGDERKLIAAAISKMAVDLNTGAWLDEWWLALKNPELNALIDQALANNADLRIAMQRVTQAQALAAQADADQWPVIKAPFEAHHDAPSNGIASATGVGSIRDRQYYQGGLAGDWQVDVWGELRSMAESAEMQLWQATYQKDDTRRKVIADVVAQYIEYLSLNDRLRVARETETVLHGLLQSVAARMKAGDATVIDLEQQRSADFAAQAAIPGLELQRETVAHGLAQLLGTTPGALTLSNVGIDSLAFPSLLPESRREAESLRLPDIPAALLLRRPDIRAVEAQLLAADADIDVARARLLPPLSLSAKTGWGYLTLAPMVMQPYGAIYNLVSNLTVTIFDHGRRAQDVALARSKHEELVETYVGAIHMAVQDTENAIAGTRKNTERLEAQQEATDSALRAWKYSEESYSAGDIDFLKLLDTERTYHRNLDELHRLRMERYKSLTALYSALGGGVPQGGALPGDGKRPGDGAPPLAANTLLYQTTGIRWKNAESRRAAVSLRLPDDEHDDKDGWLIALTGLQDRPGVAHAWRDLNHRFPDLMKDRIAIPRLQGRVRNEREERAAWYRLFIARFASAEEAGAACGQLNGKQVRCQVVAADAEAFKEVLQDDWSPDCPASASGTCQPDKPAVAVADTPATTTPETTAQKPTAPSAVATAAAPAITEKAGEPKPVPRPPASAPPPAMAQRAPSKVRLGYTIQLHTMVSQANAENAAADWGRKGYKAYVSPQTFENGRTAYHVRTGTYKNRAQAEAGVAALRKRAKVDAIAVPIDLDDAHQAVQQVKPPKRG